MLELQNLVAALNEIREHLAAGFLRSDDVGVQSVAVFAHIFDPGQLQKRAPQIPQFPQRPNDNGVLFCLPGEDFFDVAGSEQLPALNDDHPVYDLGQLGENVRTDENGFTQAGHREGSIEAAHGWGPLGPDAYLSHCVDITEREIAICAETDTRIVHNPSAVASIKGRCPVPELQDAGVTVAIGSDGAAPDRSFDQFRHMQQCMHYHRRHFRDDQVMPPGKVLEMVTTDAARTLGLEKEIGTLEVGKRADLVLLDLRKPHLAPANMPLYRATCFANGADIDTTIINGRILMRGRRMTSIDEADVLDKADREAALAIERCGLSGLLETPPGFWGGSRY